MIVVLSNGCVANKICFHKKFFLTVETHRTHPVCRLRDPKLLMFSRNHLFTRKIIYIFNSLEETEKGILKEKVYYRALRRVENFSKDHARLVKSHYPDTSKLNSTRAWPRNTIRKRFHNLVVVIGSALRLHEQL